MGKRRHKYGYNKDAKRYKGPELQAGNIGFLFTFNKGRDRQAKNEAYELLNTYADLVFPETATTSQVSETHCLPLLLSLSSNHLMPVQDIITMVSSHIKPSLSRRALGSQL